MAGGKSLVVNTVGKIFVTHLVAFLRATRSQNSSFVVKDRAAFARSIMPTFFRMSKFSSFQRQLNLYDFKRITAGPDKGGKVELENGFVDTVTRRAWLLDW